MIITNIFTAWGRTILLCSFAALTGLIFASWDFKEKFNKDQNILKVPGEFPTIADAAASANNGDWIIISPGIYKEKGIEINKSVTISSEWKITGDESIIDKTIIDAEDSILFTVSADGVEISGLKLINGDHTLNSEARVSIINNHFLNNLDGMSFESGGGGYVARNLAINDRDDALDLDILSGAENSGSDIIVEQNVFINCNDDGIEIRLFEQHNQNIRYTIRENTIIGSKNAAVQLISYDEFTGKQFFIHHNIFRNCKTGLGCMEGSKTREDLSGASKMDELVYFNNNTLIGNQMGATGGNRIVAFNNLVTDNSMGGFKHFGPNSVVRNNLFYMNGGDDLIDFHHSVSVDGNISSDDPMLNDRFEPDANSPCIDAGIRECQINDEQSFKVTEKYIAGKSPDIGAVEMNGENNIRPYAANFYVSAGEDLVLRSPKSSTMLKGQVVAESNSSLKTQWKLESPSDFVEIVSPNHKESEALFRDHGIYRFSFSGIIDNYSVSDDISVRYVNDGNGEMSFLQESNLIEAENYAYSYGHVAVDPDVNQPGNKFVRLSASDRKSNTSIEFSIGNSQYSNCFIWLRVKNDSQVKSILDLNFNGSKLGETTVLKNKKWKWIPAFSGIYMTAGQWPFVIRNIEGSVLIDKILFSYDEKFDPNN
ncbi:MAG: hypothetical protein ACFHWX_15370 [Bacteroidota bacterium]